MTKEPDRPATLDFPVVGIGTSSGGLAALKCLLDAMPTDSGMAFVIIQHLDPNHKSLTAALLDRHTEMPVVEVEDRMAVESDHVYVIPPNAELTLRNGTLHTQAPTMQRGMRMPIDTFFRSLAEEQQQAAIGILLTGTGTDGTQGLKAIKGNAGMAMAQDPESAEFDGMVRSAIGAGLVDYVVPVERMPAVLLEYVRRARPLVQELPPLERAVEQDGLDEILRRLREEQQHAIEDLEASNEELETARAELQSMNEELSTLNTQLEGKLTELEAANDKLQNLFANTDIAILFLDQQQRIRMFTPATRALFNLIPGDMGRSLGDISHHIADRDLRRDIVGVLRNMAPMETEVRTADGRWYVQRLRPYRTHDDRIEGVVATFVEITDRKRAEYADRSLATVVRDSNDAVLTVDLEGRILGWNRGAELIYGWSEADMLGKSIEMLMPEGNGDETRTFLARLTQGSHHETFETRRCARDGRELIMWMTATAVTNDQGKTIAVTCTERDITALRQVERELKFAMLAAEQSNTQKTLVLASASHDLRQPLQSLTLLNSVLARQVTDPQARKVIASQADNLVAMQSLLDSLLDIAQLDLGRVEPATSVVASDDICARMRTMFQSQAEQKGLELRTRCSSAMVRSDRELLQRIVHNLVSNAIRHTEKGAVLIACRRRGDTLCIQVWDTGPGIPEDQLEDIFTMFHQLGNPARERGKGLGLGLAIANRMARILGHPLTVRSRVGRGSVFAVEVPIVAGTPGLLRSERQSSHARRPGTQCEPGSAAGAHDAPLATPTAAHSRTDIAANILSVLLIEDDLGVGGALTMLGKVSGQVWHWALQGEDALQQLDDSSLEPDILISDFRLPGGLSGLEVIAAIRARLQRQVPAILLTGDVTSLQREEVERLGCRLLYKPVDDTRLLALISEMVPGAHE